MRFRLTSQGRFNIIYPLRTDSIIRSLTISHVIKHIRYSLHPCIVFTRHTNHLPREFQLITGFSSPLQASLHAMQPHCITC